MEDKNEQRQTNEDLKKINEVLRDVDLQVFTESTEQYRRELQLHCYRMVGSFEDSEDLVQETFIRAWQKRETFQGRSSLRAWLYRISTNVCLDFLRGRARRKRYVATQNDHEFTDNPLEDLPWLQPYPDHLLMGYSEIEEPSNLLVEKETIELVFIISLQRLSSRQRAVLIFRDVLGWSTKDTATILEISEVSVKSALQRARQTLRQHLPDRRNDWKLGKEMKEEEEVLVQRFIKAHERGDIQELAELLSEDARLTMPPHPMWFEGSVSILSFAEEVFDPTSKHYHGKWRGVYVSANRQPAIAGYIQLPGEATFRAQVLIVIRIEQSKIVEMISFVPELFPIFELPVTLE